MHCKGKVTLSLVSAPSRHEKPDSENIPPSKHHHHPHRNAAHHEHPKAEPDAKTRGEGDGRGSEKMERKSERMESKKEPLAKANGIAGQEVPSEPGSPYPEAPRVPASAERPSQPNGWPYASPSRPGSTAYPPPDGESAAQRRGFAPRTNPDKIAQRKSSMTQLQQWVNSRRGAMPPEELQRCELMGMDGGSVGGPAPFLQGFPLGDALGGFFPSHLLSWGQKISFLGCCGVPVLRCVWDTLKS